MTVQSARGLGRSGTNSPDPYAQWNYDQVKLNGLAPGAYHFFYPLLPGPEQAECFVAQHSVLGLDDNDIMYLDNESANGVAPVRVAAGALAFMTKLDKLRRHNPRGVYTFTNLATGGYWAGRETWPLSLAYLVVAAPALPPPWAKWTFWPWGLRDGTDTDAFNGTSVGLNAWISSYAKEPPRQEVIWLTAHNRPHGFSGHHSRRPLDTDLARGENHGGIRD